MATRVLLVDIQPAVTRELTNQLIDCGCHVDVAGGAPQALKALEEQPYDFVLTGMGSSTQGGMDLARSIRKAHPQTRVIVAAGDGGAVWTKPEEGGMEILFNAPEPRKVLDLLFSRRRKTRGAVLLVDDQLEDVAGLSKILENEGYAVLTASTGEEAVQIARRNRVDVAIVDYKMPGMSGWDTYEALKAVDPGIRCVIATGCSLADYVQKCFDANDVPVVNKVFNPREMFGLVNAHLRTRQEAESGTLLLVDDDAMIREDLAEFLKGEGFLVQTAGHGQGALDLVKEVDFDVAVVDYQLPDMSGLELVEGIRNLRAGTKVLVLTGHPDIDSAVQAVHLGVHEYLSKPVHPKKIVEILRRALRERRLERQIQELAHELHGANARLEELDRVKSRFLFIVAHDIRSPLAAVRGFAQYFLDGVENLSPRLRQGLEHIANGARNISRLVEDLMDLGRMETGRLAVHRERVALPKLLEGVAERLAAVAKEEKMDLRWDFSGAPASVDADPLRLEQIIANLVGNALKHARSGGRVDLTVRAREGRLLVAVEDHGPGIPRAALEKIFDPYYQEDGAAGHGIGLGLSIVKELAEAHGGRVWAESGGPGAGSLFQVEIPLQAPAAAGDR